MRVHPDYEAHDARVYAWEERHIDHTTNTGLVFKLLELWRDAGRKTKLRIAMTPGPLSTNPRLVATHQKTKGDHLIWLPMDCGDAIALHELAHALVDAKLRRAVAPFPHGTTWADHYIGLLDEHMGADAWALRYHYGCMVTR